MVDSLKKLCRAGAALFAALLVIFGATVFALKAKTPAEEPMATPWHVVPQIEYRPVNSGTVETDRIIPPADSIQLVCKDSYGLAPVHEAALEEVMQSAIEKRSGECLCGNLGHVRKEMGMLALRYDTRQVYRHLQTDVPYAWEEALQNDPSNEYLKKRMEADLRFFEGRQFDVILLYVSSVPDEFCTISLIYNCGGESTKFTECIIYVTEEAGKRFCETLVDVWSQYDLKVRPTWIEAEIEARNRADATP